MEKKEKAMAGGRRSDRSKIFPCRFPSGIKTTFHSLVSSDKLLNWKKNIKMSTRDLTYQPKFEAEAKWALTFTNPLWGFVPVVHTSSMSLKSYCINAHVSDMCCCGIIDPHQINTNHSDNYQLPCWPLFYWHWLCESAEQSRADVCKRRNPNRSNWDCQTISSTTHLLLWHSYACQGVFTRSYINTSHGTALWIWVIVTIATKQKKIPWHEWNTWACPIKC